MKLKSANDFLIKYKNHDCYTDYICYLIMTLLYEKNDFYCKVGDKVRAGDDMVGAQGAQVGDEVTAGDDIVSAQVSFSFVLSLSFTFSLCLYVLEIR